MEKVAPDIAYRRLKYVIDWRLVQENQRAAFAGIVHGISRLDAARHWGDGTTSASDGQRFAMPHKVLQQVLQHTLQRLRAEQWDRIGQFYAAFPAGHATASAALQRLNRFQASNRFYAANRGARSSAEDRIRAAVHVRAATAGRRCGGACSRVEQLHALARAVYYGSFAGGGEILR